MWSLNLGVTCHEDYGQRSLQVCLRDVLKQASELQSGALEPKVTSSVAT